MHEPTLTTRFQSPIAVNLELLHRRANATWGMKPLKKTQWSDFFFGWMVMEDGDLWVHPKQGLMATGGYSLQ